MTPSPQREENRITKLAIWHSGSVSLSCQFLVAIYFQDIFFFPPKQVESRSEGFILRTPIMHMGGTAPNGNGWWLCTSRWAQRGERAGSLGTAACLGLRSNVQWCPVRSLAPSTTLKEMYIFPRSFNHFDLRFNFVQGRQRRGSGEYYFKWLWGQKKEDDWRQG